MAECVIRQLIDDIDGTDMTEGKGGRVEFSVHGITYENDLSAAQRRLAARMVGERRSQRARNRQLNILQPSERGHASNGHEMSDKGRIKAGIVDALNASN